MHNHHPRTTTITTTTRRRIMSPRKKRKAPSSSGGSGGRGTKFKEEDEAELERDYESLTVRHTQVQERLATMTLPVPPGAAPRATKLLPAVSSSSEHTTTKQKSDTTITTSFLVPHQAPLRVKTDTHWDFVLKEMQWSVTNMVIFGVWCIVCISWKPLPVSNYLSHTGEPCCWSLLLL